MVHSPNLLIKLVLNIAQKITSPMYLTIPVLQHAIIGDTMLIIFHGDVLLSVLLILIIMPITIRELV